MSISIVCGQSYPVSPSENDLREVEALQKLTYQNINKGHLNLDSYLNQLLDIYERCYGYESQQYADCLMWCAMICAQAGDENQADKLIKHSENLFKMYGTGPFDGMDTVNLIFCYDTKSIMEYKSYRTFMAISWAKKSHELKKKMFGDTSLVYLNS